MKKINFNDNLEKSPTSNVYALLMPPIRQKFELSNPIESGKKALYREKAQMSHLYYLWG